MAGVTTKPRVVYNKEEKTAETRVFLWDNPELKRAFHELVQKEKVQKH